MEKQKQWIEGRDTEIIAGDTTTLFLSIVTQDAQGNTVRAWGVEEFEVEILIAKKNEEEKTILTKTATYHDDSIFFVRLGAEDTANLDGIYTYQFTVTTDEGEKYTRAAGNLLVKKGIKKE